MARYRRLRVLVLFLLLTISNFSSPNRYSFDTDAILESNFKIGISVVCVMGLFYLLRYCYYSSTNDKEIGCQFTSESTREHNLAVEKKKGPNQETVHFVSVPKQKGADCGFHAVKNVKLLVGAHFTNTTDLEKIISDAGFSELEEWRKYIKEKFKDTDSLDVE